jgi:hypothetical protein
LGLRGRRPRADAHGQEHAEKYAGESGELHFSESTGRG